MGSEDFSFYTEKIPSCFYYIGNGKSNDFILHESVYDFNDEVIYFAALFWVKIFENAFSIKIINNN